MKTVGDDVVSRWVHGLPLAKQTTIISLLGRKQASGCSEFSYYSFCGGWDTDAERGDQLTFEAWLRQHHPDRHIRVLEFPTVDALEGPVIVPERVLTGIADAIRSSISRGETVVIMDSAGCSRTGAVRRYLNLKQVSLYK